MGRSGGCCNFQHSANCTAPPCPSGSCCYITEPITSDNLTNLHEAYQCEDGVTENCCLSKPFSLFNEGAECGIQEACQEDTPGYSWTIPEVYNSNKAFALLKPDGKFAVWGAFVQTGDLGSSYEDASVYYSKLNEFNKDFKFVDCVANKEGFLFLNHDGAYRLFGSRAFAPTSSAPESSRLKKGSIVPINSFLVGSDLTVPKEVGVKYYPSQGGFAGISIEGKLVINWNHSFFFNIEEPLPVEIKDKTDFVEVASCHRFVAAKDSTGKVYIISLPYGYIDFDSDGNQSGGGVDNGQYVPEIEYEVENVHKIYTNNQAFSFLHNDKTVSAWGDQDKGGYTGINQPLLTDVKEVYNTDEAFLALREDGKIVVWGNIQSNAGPSSTFYDIVREVHPSRTCFGIVYDKNNRSYFDIVGSFFSYSQGVGLNRVNTRTLVVTKTHHQTEAEVCEQVNHSRWVGCLDAVTTSLPILLGNNIQDKYPWSSTPRVENNEQHFIFASNWAFYIMDAYTSQANFFLTRDGSRFYVVGVTPDNEPTGHSTKLDHDVLNPRYISRDFTFTNGNTNKKDRNPDRVYPSDSCAQLDSAILNCDGVTVNDGGLLGRDNTICPFDDSFRWHQRPAGYVPHLQRDIKSCVDLSDLSIGGDPNDKVRKFTRTQNVFAFTERASSFITKNMNQFISFAPHVHSMGHINYGGWGGTEANFTSFKYPNLLVEGPLSRNGNFYGIFSNNHAFCAVMAFVEDEQGNLLNYDEFPSRVKFLIKTWGDQRYGGKSPFDPIRPKMGYFCGEEFRSESFGEVISQLTFEGCHPDHCNQDIT